MVDLEFNELRTLTQQDYLTAFISFVRQHMDEPQFNLTVKREWRSLEPDYRLKIRAHLSTVDSYLFSRTELALLADLNHLPKAAEGFVSISHCTEAGGYSFSLLEHGFDVEAVQRISDAVIQRTASVEELQRCPHKKFLWVAKEAAFKALNQTLKDSKESLLITDVECKNWIDMSFSLTEGYVYSYQIKSTKSVQTLHNIGFVYSTPTLLVSVFFR